MKIAVVGALEGNLKSMYEELCETELNEQVRIDLVLICGNFEAVRTEHDLKCVDQYECWVKSDFQDYYSGKQKASHLTLIIGGNQEASNYFKTLPYGGWVAPNIFYMGHSNVLQFNGLRIAGISGSNDKFFDHIYKTEITKTGYYERLPLDARDRRSICYTRYIEAYRMMQLKESLDIMFTFDWPVDVLGDKQSTIDILGKVPFAMQNGALFSDLGSEMYKTLLDQLAPRMWFAGKVRYGLDKIYQRSSGTPKTHFYSLNPFLPKRKRLVLIDVDAPNQNGLQYDLEWLAILKATNQFVSVERTPNPELPELNARIKESLEEEKQLTRSAFKDDFAVPMNFSIDLPIKSVSRLTTKGTKGMLKMPLRMPLKISRKINDTDPQRERNYVSKQTKSFCCLMEITDPNQMILDSTDQDRTCQKKTCQEKIGSFKSTCLESASYLAGSLCAQFKTTKKQPTEKPNEN